MSYILFMLFINGLLYLVNMRFRSRLFNDYVVSILCCMRFVVRNDDKNERNKDTKHAI
ncbi:hypothetical protein VHA01S_019_00930 [Vibrio halioticoli NBRC 102217]|uniref:Uncharacterized protein n=1 Tax=Vibrio halioticoli NBRC 102217 TaxID=1219072 RepID=V5FHW3_9VIBR|nr:hypothetical protein VHA01S_019_00930 [Vibrio halioticoli NBRC 102217]